MGYFFLFNRDELVEGLWGYRLFNEAHHRHTPFFVLQHQHSHVIVQFHRMGQIGTRLEHSMEVLK